MLVFNFKELFNISEGNSSQLSSDSLSKKAIDGTKWIFTLRILRRIISLIRNVILARLLIPGDFGLLGVAFVSISALSTFSQTGFRAALVQKKEDIDEYLDVAWTLQVLRGFFIVIAIYFLAPYLAIFFKEPRATDVIRVFACIELFRGFANIKIVFFQRNLEFNKQFIYELFGTLVDLLVVIPLALILRNVWALVFGMLSNEATLCLLSYKLYRYKPKFSICWAKAKRLFSFGRWITLGYIVGFLKGMLNDVFISRLIGISALGIYQMATRIANLSSTDIIETATQVIFPTYSKIQDNLERLKIVYLKTLKLISFLSIFISGGIFILSDNFVQAFLGEKWLSIIWPMKLLAIASGCGAIGAASTPLFMGIGKPGISSKISFFSLIVLALLAYPFIKMWGVIGASIVILCVNFISATLRLTFSWRILRVSTKELMPVLIYPLAIFCGVFSMSDGLSLLAFNLNIHTRFILLAIYFLFSFLSLTFLLERFLNYNIWPLFRRFLPSISKI